MTTKSELRKAFKDGLISENKFKEELFKLEVMPKKKREKRHYEGVTEEEFKKILAQIKSKKIMIACYLAYGSGLRVEEIVNLQHDDIRLNRHSIFVRQGKGSKDRITNSPIGFKAEWLKYFPLGITKAAIEKAFHIASMKANINRVIFSFKTRNGKTRNKYRLHFHCLRHSFGTRALENGVPINQVQVLLGHANVSTTNEYVKANPTSAIQSIIDKGV